jgi:5-hydroxyisourate hydrolase
MSLSTHVLDASLGHPARGVPIVLSRGDGTAAVPVVSPIFTAFTDSDGRYRYQQDGRDVQLPAGVYELTFDTAAYFAASGQTGFYPKVTVTFEITDAGLHHHVPLLLSPFAFSTYRGS